MLPVLRKGTVLQVSKPFDVSMVQIGDRGVIVKEALPESVPKPQTYTPGPMLHLYVVKPTHGALPLYNSDIPERVEDGTFRIVEEVTHAISDEDMEAVRTRMEEYQDPRAKAYYEELNLIFIKLEDLNLRRYEDRDKLDAQIFNILLKKGGQRIAELRCEYTSGYYQNRYELLEASAHRLVVSGKILPFKEGAALVPCR